MFLFDIRRTDFTWKFRKLRVGGSYYKVLYVITWLGIRLSIGKTYE